MQNYSLPLLFFAFANDKTRPLHAIPKEFNELDNLLLTKKHLCEAQFKPNISAYDFHHVISALGKDIYIIHYGGILMAIKPFLQMKIKMLRLFMEAVL